MADGADITRITALIADPACGAILSALRDGRARTPVELAAEAGIAPQIASSLVAQLEAGGLIRLWRQGRHRYAALAGEEVARRLEGRAAPAAPAQKRTRFGPRDAATRRARVCYDHLAGEMGVRLWNSLEGRGLIVEREDGVALTPAGACCIEGLGIDLAALARRRAPLCRACLDWSERRPHLGGSIGRALMTRMEALGWAQRVEGSRTVTFTAEGERAFAAAFPVAA